MKNVGADELASAIRTAHAGGSALSPEAAVVLTRRVGQPSSAPALSERELEVLRLLVQGLSNPEIGERLGVSRSTVKFHVAGLLARLGVSTRTKAVALALRMKLVD